MTPWVVTDALGVLWVFEELMQDRTLTLYQNYQARAALYIIQGAGATMQKMGVRL